MIPVPLMKLNLSILTGNCQVKYIPRFIAHKQTNEKH